MSIARYEPDLERPSPKKRGPLIIRQEDAGPGPSFKEDMTPDDCSEVYTPDRVYPRSNSLFPQSDPAAKSFTYRRQDLGGQPPPSPLNTFLQDSRSPGAFRSPTWSPTGNASVDFSLQSPIYSPYSPGAIGQERGTPLPSNVRHSIYIPQRGHAKVSGRDYASGHHNVVDVDRIRQGIDVRTTVQRTNCS